MKWKWWTAFLGTATLVLLGFGLSTFLGTVHLTGSVQPPTTVTTVPTCPTGETCPPATRAASTVTTTVHIDYLGIGELICSVATAGTAIYAARTPGRKERKAA